jgi:hypothetical protein
VQFMSENLNSIQTPQTRLGFHYYPDYLHYRENDLNAWLPEARAMGATWMTLSAPADRAIPEAFISGLLRAGVDPILHFQIPLNESPAPAELSLLLETYARWGVHYAVFFDKPNSRAAWGTKAWAQEDLVERFLDRFVPLAEMALHSGLTPVFPPLEPGGNYWDTAFLHAALESLQRRKQARLLQQTALSAYAWTNNHPLNWGAGGPERWPGTHPYLTLPNEEDQRGFHIFDWYLAISRQVLGTSLPILLFQLGQTLSPEKAPVPIKDPALHAQAGLAMAQLLMGEKVEDPAHPGAELDAIPPEVLCGNFWLLACEPASPLSAQAWFQANGAALPVAGVVRQWWANRRENHSAAKTIANASAPTQDERLPISHYLLLPSYEWGVSDWHLDIIRPFIKKHQPTIGFSLQEAAFAAHVTVVGGEQSFSEASLVELQAHGCQVERISGDGITIATKLAER